MADKYQNKYRIQSTRLPNWDYGWNASYFVTICTQNRIHYFGEIVGGVMQFSEIGQMAEKFWHEIPQHFPFVELDAFVVMPNHIHGIITIAKTDSDRKIVDGVDGGGNGDGIGDGYGGGDGNGDGNGDGDTVETQNFASLQQQRQQQQQQPPIQPSNVLSETNPQPKNKFGPQSKNLASIIRGYKIGVTKNAIKIHGDWAWQSRYHDHIIRDEKSYNRIKQYIINNPKNWNNDKFYN